jgi:hypothetical protein
VCSAKVVSLRVRAAWQSLREAKPPLVSRRRSSVSRSSPPQAGQASFGRRSIQKRLPQLWQRWAPWRPTSRMYSHEPDGGRLRTWPCVATSFGRHSFALN